MPILINYLRSPHDLDTAHLVGPSVTYQPLIAVGRIDEADSLLSDRSHARQNWEVTQANELLTQVEQFEGLLVCTIKRFDPMYPASRRRFSHKFRFDPMSPACAWGACREVAAQLGINELALAEIRADILSKIGLTPGDFAVVLKLARHLPDAPTARWLNDAQPGDTAGRYGARLRFGFAA